MVILTYVDQIIPNLGVSWTSPVSFPMPCQVCPPHATLQLQIGQAMRIAARGELLGQAEVETWKSAARSMEDFMGKMEHVFFRMFIESNGIVIGFLIRFWWDFMENCTFANDLPIKSGDFPWPCFIISGQWDTHGIFKSSYILVCNKPTIL